MFATQAPVSRQSISTRFNRRLTALIGAMALAIVVAGSVSAVELVQDDNSPAIVTPGLDSLDLVQFKLRTTAGYNVLVFG